MKRMLAVAALAALPALSFAESPHIDLTSAFNQLQAAVGKGAQAATIDGRAPRTPLATTQAAMDTGRLLKEMTAALSSFTATAEHVQFIKESGIVFGIAPLGAMHADKYDLYSHSGRTAVVNEDKMRADWNAMLANGVRPGEAERLLVLAYLPSMARALRQAIILHELEALHGAPGAAGARETVELATLADVDCAHVFREVTELRPDAYAWTPRGTRLLGQLAKHSVSLFDQRVRDTTDLDSLLTPPNDTGFLDRRGLDESRLKALQDYFTEKYASADSERLLHGMIRQRDVPLK